MIGGAVARVGREETAFGERDGSYNLLILGRSQEPPGDSATMSWARSLWKAAQPFSTGGVFDISGGRATY